MTGKSVLKFTKAIATIFMVTSVFMMGSAAMKMAQGAEAQLPIHARIISKADWDAMHHHDSAASRIDNVVGTALDGEDRKNSRAKTENRSKHAKGQAHRQEAAARTKLPHRHYSDDTLALFQAMDIDGSGGVSLREYLIGTQQPLNANHFERDDLDRDGTISLRELKRAQQVNDLL